MGRGRVSSTGNGLDLGLSPFHGRPPGFRNALIQNIAGGHTMVMNRAAREILIDSGVRDAFLHDWWTYMIVSGAGGRVFYDLHPPCDIACTIAT